MATTKPPWSQYEGVAAMFKVGNSKELPEIPDHLSNDGKDFVMKCLQRNPSCRPTAAQLLEHPFVKYSSSLERSVLSAEPLESIPALTHAVNALGFGCSGTSRCSELSGAINHSKSPKTFPEFSDGYMVRNISCPVSPSGDSHPPLHIQGRLSPSPMSNHRVASGASTLPGGSSKATIPPCHPNKTRYKHKPNIFRGVLQKAHSSVGTLLRENDTQGNKVKHPVLWKE